MQDFVVQFLQPDVAEENREHSHAILRPKSLPGTAGHRTRIPSAVWLEVAERGQKTGIIHWKVACICRTIQGYAAGGWERKPSAKQAENRQLKPYSRLKEPGW